MEDNKQVTEDSKNVQPISYEEAFKKLSAFILKTKQQETQKQQGDTSGQE